MPSSPANRKFPSLAPPVSHSRNPALSTSVDRWRTAIHSKPSSPALQRKKKGTNRSLAKHHCEPATQYQSKTQNLPKATRIRTDAFCHLAVVTRRGVITARLEAIVARAAMKMVTRAPNIMRESKSRPRLSVPSQCAAEAGSQTSPTMSVSFAGCTA